ncbi:DUF4426 domain-containing protein [Agarilytica rhodophyticola]|uniref:DUF4426 domain-containing protein n=1 Tax=Agarilytica rhodophyticola TaxID=1737490 RepID=UPI000B349633|nr:DUF4426 domain-containing protein [Agarilytica rhodophyticola]
MRNIIFLACMLALLSTSFSSYAQRDPNLKFQTEVGDFAVNHVVFNSTFVLPEVAKIYKLKRSKYESLLNISVNRKNIPGTVGAKLSGTVTNLLQQQKSLKFIEIKEENSIYYLAPIRIANEEVLHFSITLRPDGTDEDLTFKFSQTVYADE